MDTGSLTNVVMIPASRIGVIDWNYVILLVAPSVIAMIFAYANFIKAKTAAILAQVNSQKIEQVSQQVEQVKVQNAIVESRVSAVAQLSTERHEDVLHKLDAQTEEILTNGGTKHMLKTTGVIPAIEAKRTEENLPPNHPVR